MRQPLPQNEYEDLFAQEVLVPNEIGAIPEVPEGLKEAAVTGTLVLFLGAGVSALAGCPRWAEFADRVIDALVKKGIFKAAQKYQLAGLSPRVKLSVAKLAAKQKNEKIDYRTILHGSGDEWANHADGRRLYSYISALSNQFVTTNYDDWLTVSLPAVNANAVNEQELIAKEVAEQQGGAGERRRCLYRPTDITPDCLTPGTVVHLHGALAEPEGMILSTSDYIQRYANDRRRNEADVENPVLRFLEFLFAERTVLFIGYGLEELEILEYVVLKARASADPQANDARHYLLLGFFSFEATLCASLQDYFLKECGIQMIPFSRDDGDWRQLIEVLREFSAALPVNDVMIAQQLVEMEALASG